MIAKNEMDLTGFDNAVKSLEVALSKKPLSDLERDGVIQRFEYTFELAWKMMRKMLIAMGRQDVSASPRPVLRDAAEEHFIEDIENWFEFLEARNLSSHIYDEFEAKKVFAAAFKFLSHAKQLVKKFSELKKQ